MLYDHKIIACKKPGDWFEKVPIDAFSGIGITVIDADRRSGKSLFIAYAVEKLLKTLKAKPEYVISYDHRNLSFMAGNFTSLYGGPFEQLTRHQIDEIETYRNGKTVIFADEADWYENEKLQKLIRLQQNKARLVLLGTSWEKPLWSRKEKSFYRSLLENPEVESFVVSAEYEDVITNEMDSGNLQEYLARRKLASSLDQR